MKNLKKITTLAVAVLVLVTPVFSATYKEKMLMEDFSGMEPSMFPDKWNIRGNGGKDIYLVKKEMGNLYLHADVLSRSVTIYKKVDWPIKEYPYLSWRWRVSRLPDGGDESKPGKNDTAAAVYGAKINIFRFNAHSVKYIWSATLPVGTEFRQKNTWVVVVESGAENMGKWMTYKVDLLEDFKRLWGKAPSSLDVLAILSDSDATASRVIADYDDLLISRN